MKKYYYYTENKTISSNSLDGNMQTNIQINLKDYNEALKISIHDDEWRNIALNQAENIEEYTKQFCKNYKEAALIYLSKKDFSKIIEYKTQPINENCMQFFMETSKEKNILDVIKNIKNKTNYMAENIAALLSEYSHQKRDLFEGELQPCPESFQETTKSIKKFKIIKDNHEIKIKILNNKIFTNSDNLNQYFLERNESKFIGRAFCNLKLEQQIQELIFFKTTSIPTNILEEEEQKYKIIFVENQAVKINNSYRTIDGSNFVVKHILRKHES